MHTIVETPSYLRAAAQAGMSEDERRAAVDTVAVNPTAGDEIKGSGGRYGSQVRAAASPADTGS
jgi:hypothetical protein